MPIAPRAAPPPGSTSPGDLYVDLQTRTIWMGVDTSVDPAGAVLLSDMDAIDAALDDTLVEAKAYTDTQVATRAPTVHTHTASQVTDFNAAVYAAIAASPTGGGFKPGMIILYSGSLANIGVGDYAGWALCDGSNGTPDMRDKFVLGAGNKAVGATNPVTQFLTGAAGAHTPVIGNTTLTLAQIPSHNHGGNTGYQSHDHAHHTSGVTDVQGNHNHTINGGNDDVHGQAAFRNGNNAGPFSTTSTNGAHQHNFAAWSGGVNQNHYHSIAAQGSGEAHTHIASAVADHQHIVTNQQLRDATPYYALAFIMKL